MRKPEGYDAAGKKWHKIIKNQTTKLAETSIFSSILQILDLSASLMENPCFTKRQRRRWLKQGRILRMTSSKMEE